MRTTGGVVASYQRSVAHQDVYSAGLLRVHSAPQTRGCQNRLERGTAAVPRLKSAARTVLNSGVFGTRLEVTFLE